MRPELAKVLEFAQEVDRINTLAKLDRAVQKVTAPFGVTYYGGHRIFDPGHLARPGVLFGNISNVWERHYTAAGHLSQDPAIRMLFETARPYTWSAAKLRFDSRGAELVYDDCKQINGTAEGLVVPVHDVDGTILTALFSGPDLDLSPEAVPALHMLGYYYVLRGRELLAERNAFLEGGGTLTPRQIECLKWVSEGKTDEEIGQILSVSDRTVHNHVEAAKKCLGATKRGQAVILAYRKGLIS